MITISVRLQVTTLQYYLHEANPANGLIRDRIHSATGQLLQLFGVDSRPQHIKEVAEASLKRLRVDAIDLFYQHRVDPDVRLRTSPAR